MAGDWMPGYRLLFGADNPLGPLVLAAGILGGLVGFLYLSALDFAQSYLWPTHHGWPMQAGILLLTGGLVGLIYHFKGNPSGIELLVDNIHVRGGARDVRGLATLIPVSLVCVASGGAAGPEAPLVQTNGVLGSLLARRWGLNRNQARIITISGMASGFGVLFGAPVGAAIFALEFLHREGIEYYEALLPASWGALCGYITCVLARGHGLAPAWNFAPSADLVPADLFWALLVGALAAAVARGFMEITTRLRARFVRLPIQSRPILGGLSLASLALISPFALTFGEEQLGELTVMQASVGMMLGLAALKLLATSFTLASGWKGGFIIPLFVVGCCLGRALHAMFPSTNEVALMTAFMAALNTGVTKTPLGSALVVTRMSNAHLIPTTLLATLVSLALSSPVNMIAAQRSRRQRSGATNPHATGGAPPLAPQGA